MAAKGLLICCTCIFFLLSTFYLYVEANLRIRSTILQVQRNENLFVEQLNIHVYIYRDYGYNQLQSRRMAMAITLGKFQLSFRRNLSATRLHSSYSLFLSISTNRFLSFRLPFSREKTRRPVVENTGGRQFSI